MKNSLLGGIGLVATVLMTSCGHADYKKTETGMAYDIITDGKGEMVKHGEFVKVNYKFMIGDSTSTMENTYGRIPAYGRIDTAMKNQHFFTDILPLMRVGDSAVVVLSMDSLVKRGAIDPNTKFAPGATKKGYLKILGVFKDEAAVEADYKKEEAAELANETAKLEKYLKDKNITVQKTPKGAFVEITNPGTGAQADTGKFVSVMYRGTNMKGEMFDSNKDSIPGKENKPLEFTMGKDPVIEGWVECMKYLKEGGKAKFYIPAMLAYKNQARSEQITPYSDLIFDVDLLSVKDAAPPVAAQPQTPIH